MIVPNNTALRLLQDPPQAGVNNLLRDAALRLADEGKTPEEAVQFIEENLDCTKLRPGRRIKPGEIERQVARAFDYVNQGGPPGMSWPRLDADHLRQVVSSGGFPTRNRVAVPTEEILGTLFPGDPRVWTGDALDAVLPAQPLSKQKDPSLRQFIVPSPALAASAKTQEGKLSGRALENIGPRRYLVVEGDETSKAEQAAVLRHLARFAPLVLVVDSAGKSLHGWFCCKAADEDTQEAFFREATKLGADAGIWTRNQVVRMPGGLRDGKKRQHVVLYEPEKIGATWRPIQERIRVTEFRGLNIPEPPAEVSLLNDGWLTRGGHALLIGITGGGKSSVFFQMAYHFALGLPCLGFEPNGPLKVMLLQVENGHLEMFKMATTARHLLKPDGAQDVMLAEAVTVLTPEKSLPSLFAEDGDFARRIRQEAPDLVLLDSLYTWLPKRTVLDTEGLMDTLHGYMLPLAKEVGFGWFMSHHAPRNEAHRLVEDRNRVTDTYAGSGGQFIIDDFRASVLLVPLKHTAKVCKLVPAKGSARLGWDIPERWVRWIGDGHLGWQEMTPAEIEAVESEAAESRENKVNRRRAQEAAAKRDAVFRAIPEEGISQKDLGLQTAVPTTTLRRCLEQLQASGRIIREDQAGPHASPIIRRAQP